MNQLSKEEMEQIIEKAKQELSGETKEMRQAIGCGCIITMALFLTAMTGLVALIWKAVLS